MAFYEEHRPTFADRRAWTTPQTLRHRALTHGDTVYLDVPWSGERYTYRETLDIAETVGRSLLAAGATPGDRILVMLPNCSAYVFAWLGSAVAGLVEVPINTAYRGSFLAHQTSTVEPTFAIIDPSYAERFVDLPDASRSIRRFYLVGDDAACDAGATLLEAAGHSTGRWNDLLRGPLALGANSHLETGSAAESVVLPEVRYNDLASIFFTSGTTGLSKGVMMPQAHMHIFADECVSLTRLTDRDVYMSVGPLFHGNSQFLAAYPALIAGARYVLQQRFSASEWLNQARECGATVTNFVGVMMDFVWQQPPTLADAGNDLRCIFAAPTAHSILGPFKERFGIETFVEVFGLTETCMPILTPHGVDRPAGAAGMLNRDWYDVRLVDPDTDEEVPVGQVGELTVRARHPWTMLMGYYGMPDKTVDVFRNLWFHTGDGLRRDHDGWYYFVDRLKDAIRRRGENISSYEVEQGLLHHGAIAEIAAIGVPADQEAGEDEVMVFVVLEPDASLSPEELWKFADRQLPAFAVPRYLRFINQLPKTPSEKVRKVELRTMGADALTADRGPQARPVRPTPPSRPAAHDARAGEPSA